MPLALNWSRSLVEASTFALYHAIMPDTARQSEEVTMRGSDVAMRGSVLVLLQFDVCETIRLDRLRELMPARAVDQPPDKHPAAAHVRYQRPPVVEPLDALVLDSGEHLQGEIKYYDYGVVSVTASLRSPATGTN